MSEYQQGMNEPPPQEREFYRQGMQGEPPKEEYKQERDDFDGGGPRKRMKREDVDPTNPDPSLVVHVRNLSQKASEADLLEALSNFGQIAYATVMTNKRMALVEFEELESSRSCVTYSQTNQIYVAGQPALFNYSTSKMIQRIGLESERPNHVLIITIFNAQYPVTVEVIHTICKAHGDVRRIAVIRRPLLQALIEFDSIESARKAKYALNGADIYSGCCTLKVEFAKPDHVKVSRNDSEQWDFTLPADQQSAQQAMGGAAGGGPAKEYRRALLPGGNEGGMGEMSQGFGGPGGPPPQHQSGYTGGGGGGGMGYQQGGYHQGQYMGGNGGGGPSGGYGGGQRGSGGSSYGPGPGYNDMMGGGGGGSSVVMVYGVEQDKLNCDKLFNLLCVYGNVIRIKFMKSKPDTAMVQMGNPEQVQTAIDNLHNSTLFGQKLALRPSKQVTLHEIRDPFNLPDETPSFKDYTGSRNQRFTTPESAARNRIVRPTNVLHWFNAPSTMTEEKIKQIFQEGGGLNPTKVVIFPVKSERSSAGICEFESVDQAMEGIVKCNHTPIDSPSGKIPYIFKLAFAGGRDGREFRQ